MKLCRDKRAVSSETTSIYLLKKACMHQCWRKQFPMCASEGWCLRMNVFPQMIKSQCLQNTSLSLGGQGCIVKSSGNDRFEILTAIAGKQHQTASGTIIQVRMSFGNFFPDDVVI